MKRGFLNSKKVKKEALYPAESTGGTGVGAKPVPALSASGAVATRTEGAGESLLVLISSPYLCHPRSPKCPQTTIWEGREHRSVLHKMVRLIPT
jgi:hypothetical protein